MIRAAVTHGHARAELPSSAFANHVLVASGSLLKFRVRDHTVERGIVLRTSRRAFDLLFAFARGIAPDLTCAFALDAFFLA